MNHQINLVNPAKLPPKAEFTPELAIQRQIEMRATPIAGQYGFRVRCLSDQTGNKRWIDAAVRYADDHALAEGVRGERLGTGEKTDYVSSAGGYTQVQLDALKRVRITKRALGAVYSEIIDQVVIQGMNSEKLAGFWDVSERTALDWGKCALEVLSSHYDGAR